MKKILTTASLAALAFVAGAITAAPVFAQDAASSPGLIIDNAPKAKQKFRYLDMAEPRRSAAIRSAVIVYEHGLGQRRCKVHDGKSASACLHGPAT